MTNFSLTGYYQVLIVGFYGIIIYNTPTVYLPAVSAHEILFPR